VGNLIGETVVNANNESLGEITDLVTDQNGKIVAVLIGSGGFLGIGQKDLAIRFEDVKLTRDENNNMKVMVDIDQQTAAAAPDYQTLDEQQITVGEKSDRENSTQ
jgi:sporulation protein YlmC with PRC-barrel domain